MREMRKRVWICPSAGRMNHVLRLAGTQEGHRLWLRCNDSRRMLEGSIKKEGGNPAGRNWPYPLLVGSRRSETGRQDRLRTAQKSTLWAKGLNGEKKSRWKGVLILMIALIFLAPLLAITFPQVTLPGIQAVDGRPFLTALYGENDSATISNIGESRGWSQSLANPGVAALNSMTDNLSLTGVFPPSNNPMAVTIFKSLSVNLTQYPILYVLMKVSKGVGYGIRFYSQQADATSLWGEADALNHRSGTGQFENIQANMVQLVEGNTARVVTTLTEVRIYLERGASSAPTSFDLQLQKIEFLKYPFTPANSVGRYHAIYFTLNRPQVSSSWILKSVTLEGHICASSNTVFVLYLIDGLSAYRGGIFNFNQASENQAYTITFPTEKVKAFPDALPTGEFSIVLVSASGTLYQFTPDRVTINYLATTPQTSSPSQHGTPDAYLAYLGVLLPLSTVILLHDRALRKRSTQTLGPHETEHEQTV